MIKKFRRKFILITLITLAVVEIIIISTINAVNFHQINNQTNELMNILVENDGNFPEPKDKPMDRDQGEKSTKDAPMFDRGFNAETRYMTRYFVVEADGENEIGKIDTGHIAAIDSATAKEYGNNVLESGKTSGYVDDYQYRVTDKDGKKLIIFIDCSMQLNTKYNFLVISCIIGAIAFIVFSVILVLVSKKAVRPYIESMEKQSRFITDAGHEIKTPLAIISANNEVIEMINGESEWTSSIKNQVNRLSDLTKELITLAKMDEDIKPVFTEFNISDAVFDTASSFVTLAKANEKTATIDIEDGIMYNGEEAAIRQLVSVLMDNAVKYADSNGEIKLTLNKSNKGCKLTVYNQCSNLGFDNPEKLFDRFYRADESRSRETGGYGIGLSIAKSIVEMHNGKISARKEQQGITFEAILK